MSDKMSKYEIGAMVYQLGAGHYDYVKFMCPAGKGGMIRKITFEMKGDPSAFGVMKLRCDAWDITPRELPAGNRRVIAADGMRYEPMVVQVDRMFKGNSQISFEYTAWYGGDHRVAVLIEWEHDPNV